ncbi:hypothetical protein [Candidatus Anaplasma sp. TIGMIC]|uniref:hypothetical protein n=1 Tax=Candidatus Anaplasma sp. TIGMIC TaxID=3020713 RepID=UPI0023309B4D|nr:hypothetical protein [Candidatus Anaplasma sp. TIGMIC]MDB1135069.1 hypothetical protein [Candidatus Anaplasma sp. TIGMIC]
MNQITEDTLGRRMYNANDTVPIVLLLCYIIFNVILVRLAVWVLIFTLAVELFSATTATYQAFVDHQKSKDAVRSAKATDKVLSESTSTYRKSTARIEMLLDAHADEAAARSRRNKALQDLLLNLAYITLGLLVIGQGFKVVLAWAIIAIIPHVFQTTGKYIRRAKQALISFRDDMLGEGGTLDKFLAEQQARRENQNQTFSGIFAAWHSTSEVRSDFDATPTRRQTHTRVYAEDVVESLPTCRAAGSDLPRSRVDAPINIISTQLLEPDLQDPVQQPLALLS